MKHTPLLCALIALSTFTPLLFWASPVQAASPDSPRQRVRMDDDWRFHLNETNGSQQGAVTDWLWRKADQGEADAAAMSAPTLDTTGDDWKKAQVGDDMFHGRVGFAWFRAALPMVAGPGRVLQFESVDDNATVFLNGVRLGHHAGWNTPFSFPIDSAYHEKGPNVLLVLVENTFGAGGITGTTRLANAKDSATGEPFAAPDFDDRKWRTVHLPHDYVVEGAFTPKANPAHGSLPALTAWYRKTFFLPNKDKGKSVWIDFDGIYRDATVYLNGVRLGEHKSGYIGVRYDIHNAAHWGGKNVLAIFVDPRHPEGWWYEGGGIYRHVWLNVADPMHIAPWGVYATARLPEPGPDAAASQAEVTLETTIANDVADKTRSSLISTIFDDAGTIVSQTSTELSFLGGTRKGVTERVPVPHPHLWSLDAPHLYTVRSEIQRDGKTVDSVTTSFGIRTIRFDANLGFFLNGKPVKIKGTCNHQDFAGVGIGMPDNLLTWRIQKLKAMGSNAYRMSHNPPAPELLDACDRLGMLVMDENRHLGDTENGKTGKGTTYADLSDLKDMICRDRNHPSIIQWSLCNEEPLQGTEEGAQIFAAMKDAVQKLDATRPITCAMDHGWGKGITLVEDLQGCNYDSKEYDAFHQQFPGKPMYGSETSSEVGTRGIYTMIPFQGRFFGDPEKGYVNAYDMNAPPWAQTAEGAWKALADRPFMAGGYVWTGFDYKGEPTPFGWPCINSHFGIMDECGFPKDTYYYYQAWWGDAPVVHILPHWNWTGKEGQAIPVWVFANAARVELLLNGKSLGVKDMPPHEHLEWAVPYAAGRLEARGLSADGKQIAVDRVETTGAPAALRLTTDRTTLTADGEDVTMVEVDVLDAQGRIVPTANDLVSFAVNGHGTISGVGNGDPSSHEPDKATMRHAFNGKCLVVVGATDRAGDLTLTASALGLADGTLKLHSTIP